MIRLKITGVIPIYIVLPSRLLAGNQAPSHDYAAPTFLLDLLPMEFLPGFSLGFVPAGALFPRFSQVFEVLPAFLLYRIGALLTQTVVGSPH